jgi:hypothetical protein
LELLGFAWICLDSLVRIETSQWVTRHKAREVFSIGFSLMAAAPGGESGSLI